MSHVCSHINGYNWLNRVRLSLKAPLNSSVFICRPNALKFQQFWPTLAEHSRPVQRPPEMLDCQVYIVRSVVGTTKMYAAAQMCKEKTFKYLYVLCMFVCIHGDS